MAKGDNRTCVFCGTTFVQAGWKAKECCSYSCTRKLWNERNKGCVYHKVCSRCGNRLPARLMFAKHMKKESLCDCCKKAEQGYTRSTKLSNTARLAKEAGMTYGNYVAKKHNGEMKHLRCIILDGRRMIV